jgi:hypothetical protein
VAGRKKIYSFGRISSGGRAPLPAQHLGGSSAILTVYQDRNGAIWAGTGVGIDRLADDRILRVPGKLAYPASPESARGRSSPAAAHEREKQ